MSLRAYMKAVKNHIKTTYSLADQQCDITPDGRGHPSAGQVFYAVHPGGFGNSKQNSLDELHTFNVTVTLRTGYAPWDRVGTSVLADDDGLLDRADRLRALIHMNYAVMNAANALIPGTAEYVAAAGSGSATKNGFVEPVIFQSATYLGEKRADWFFAEGADDSITGVAMQLTFARGRRVQDISGQS